MGFERSSFFVCWLLYPVQVDEEDSLRSKCVQYTMHGYSWKCILISMKSRNHLPTECLRWSLPSRPVVIVSTFRSAKGCTVSIAFCWPFHLCSMWLGVFIRIPQTKNQVQMKNIGDIRIFINGFNKDTHNTWDMRMMVERRKKWYQTFQQKQLIFIFRMGGFDHYLKDIEEGIV